jgi:hypothetical protein
MDSSSAPGPQSATSTSTAGCRASPTSPSRERPRLRGARPRRSCRHPAPEHGTSSEPPARCRPPRVRHASGGGTTPAARPPRVPPRRSSAAAPHRGGVPASAARAATERVEPLQAVQPAGAAGQRARRLLRGRGGRAAGAADRRRVRPRTRVGARPGCDRGSDDHDRGPRRAAGHRSIVRATCGPCRAIKSGVMPSRSSRFIRPAGASDPLPTRWCLAFGDLLDAESPLRVVELRRYESA